jgi:hypothetical protein
MSVDVSAMADPQVRDAAIAYLEEQGYTVRAPGERGPCDAIKPGTLDDVLPLRCRLPRRHRDSTHWHPPLWPGTPDVLWVEDEEQ